MLALGVSGCGLTGERILPGKWNPLNHKATQIQANLMPEALPSQRFSRSFALNLHSWISLILFNIYKIMIINNLSC